MKYQYYSCSCFHAAIPWVLNDLRFTVFLSALEATQFVNKLNSKSPQDGWRVILIDSDSSPKVNGDLEIVDGGRIIRILG